MKKNNKRTKFKTEYNRSEISEKAEPYDWVPKVQIFGACYLFFALMNIATEADIWWKGSLYGIGAICVV